MYVPLSCHIASATVIVKSVGVLAGMLEYSCPSSGDVMTGTLWLIWSVAGVIVPVKNACAAAALGESGSTEGLKRMPFAVSSFARFAKRCRTDPVADALVSPFLTVRRTSFPS